MRVKLCLIGVLLIGSTMPVLAARPAPEARLAKTLEGRVAGKPVNCIAQRQIQSTEIFERTAIVYKMGRTWYVNRPVNGANFLDRNDVLVTDTRSPDLCNVDIVRLLDPGTRFQSGTIGLGNFVPYTKPKS